jgi:hypothetical protein
MDLAVARGNNGTFSSRRKIFSGTAPIPAVASEPGSDRVTIAATFRFQSAGVGGRRFYFPNERRGHAADVALRRRAITETMSASGASIIEQGDLEALGEGVARCVRDPSRPRARKDPRVLSTSQKVATPLSLDRRSPPPRSPP